MGLNVDFNRVSDDRYFVDLTSQVRQSSIGNLQQDAYVSYAGKLRDRSVTTRRCACSASRRCRIRLARSCRRIIACPSSISSTSANNIGGVLDTNLPLEYARFVHSSLQQGRGFRPARP